MQQQTLKAKGLYTFQNDFSELPEGAMTVADNVEVKREGIVEPRRGFRELTHKLTNDTDRVEQVFDFDDAIIAHKSDGKISKYDTVSGFVDYTGTYAAADVNLGRLKSVYSNNNAYFLTSGGVVKLEDKNLDIVAAGVPKALGASGSLNAASGGFLNGGDEVCYRIIWGIKDANNNLLLGSPSERLIVKNTNGAGTYKDVDVNVPIPGGISTSHFAQVYRSASFTSSTTTADDELGLVYEYNPTGTNITNGYFTFTDQTPSELRGATLYTSPSQEGISQSNDEPPFAKDAQVFKEYLFLANTVSKQRLIFTIISVGGTSGIQDGDTITINDIVFEADTAENVAANKYQLYTGGSASQNIADTAQSLVNVINRTASAVGVYAYYLSGEDDLPGKILLEERSIGGAAFDAVVSARGAAFNPNLTTAVSSEADVFKNGLYYSKYRQPEAFPLTNYYLVGNSNHEILRILSSRDSLFIFKSDGIFRLTGYSPDNFRIEQFDTTTQLLSPDSAVRLNNQVYMLSTQGVVVVSDTGISVISRPIENVFLDLLGRDSDALKKATFGVPYESDRKYVLYLPQQIGDTFCRQAYIYNLFTQAWTRWVRETTCGIVKQSDDLLYCGNGTRNSISVERKSYSYTDYNDEGIERNIIAFSGNQVQLDDASGFVVGDLLYQGTSAYAIATAIDTETNTVTTLVSPEWTIGSVQIYFAIDCQCEYAPMSVGNIYMNKHFRETLFMFKDSFFGAAQAGYSTNISPTTEYVVLTGQGLGGWGAFPWGSSPWGNVSYSKPYRVLVPRDKRRAAWIKVRFACRYSQSKFLLDGVCFTFNAMNERVTR